MMSIRRAWHLQADPVFLAALEVVRSLHQRDVDEMRSYVAPPAGLLVVTDAICILFKQTEIS